MKKVHTLIVLFSVLIMCCSNPTTESSVADSPNSDQANTLIVDSIKALVNGFVKAAEEVNSDELLKYFSGSPDLRVINQDGQMVAGIDSIRPIVHSYFTSLAFQKFKPSESFVKVLSQNVAVATYASEFTAYRKDSSTFGGTFGWTFVCVKQQEQWRILNLQQSIKWRDLQLVPPKRRN